jgi:hypothetical protein
MSHQTTTLAFRARATGSDLKLTARLNDRVFFDQQLNSEETVIKYDFPDADDTEYLLEIEMTGKLPAHTKIDSEGNITEDRVIEIYEFIIDDVEVTQLFTEKVEYHHDFNGSKDPIVDEFFGSIGCNGVLKFKFTTPVYIWLLENM